MSKVIFGYIVNLPSGLAEQEAKENSSVPDISTKNDSVIGMQDNVQEALAVHEQLMDEYNSAFERLAK